MQRLVEAAVHLLVKGVSNEKEFLSLKYENIIVSLQKKWNPQPFHRYIGKHAFALLLAIRSAIFYLIILKAWQMSQFPIVLAILKPIISTQDEAS